MSTPAGLQDIFESQFLLDLLVVFLLSAAHFNSGSGGGESLFRLESMDFIPVKWFK